MEEEGARRLELLAPLLYIPAPALEPFHPGARPGEGEGKEFLFCFALDESQGRSIEPEPSIFLGPLLAAGFADPAAPGGSLELPRGPYLFAQEWAFLDREETIRMAVEAQKDGLWERLRLENRLYLRYLSGDGGVVTQIFRPYRPPERET
ncbi:MAG: hypothetical protein LBH51_07880 [Treponema sp.]|nr:hypothetical protein [Treponema sp.]